MSKNIIIQEKNIFPLGFICSPVAVPQEPQIIFVPNQMDPIDDFFNFRSKIRRAVICDDDFIRHISAVLSNTFQTVIRIRKLVIYRDNNINQHTITVHQMLDLQDQVIQIQQAIKLQLKMLKYKDLEKQ